MLEVRSHPRKGRGLFTTRLVRGGETVLSEGPLLLVVGSAAASATCAHCLRLLPSGPRNLLSVGSSAICCTSCNQASFCSPVCAAAATSLPWGHPPSVCRAYGVLGALSLPSEQHDQLRFLVHALSLLQLEGAAPGSRFAQLLALTGDTTPQDVDTASRLAPHLQQAMGASLAGTSVPEVAALLRREQLNSYGVLAAHGRGGERKLRGSGVYAQASLINHECAPNVARYDNFDSDRPDSTSIHFRAMHDLPAGTELAQSYCPLNWDFQTRQRQCRDVYGFVCCCPRCQTEQTEDLAAAAGGSQCSSDGWQTDDEGGSAAGSGAASDDGREADDAAAEEEMLDAESEQVGPLPAGEEPPLDPTYLHLFLLKYVCPRRDCFGTLAPAAPGSGSHECNVCGRQRSEAQFMSSLESKQRR